MEVANRAQLRSSGSGVAVDSLIYSKPVYTQPGHLSIWSISQKY